MHQSKSKPESQGSKSAPERGRRRINVGILRSFQNLKNRTVKIQTHSLKTY